MVCREALFGADPGPDPHVDAAFGIVDGDEQGAQQWMFQGGPMSTITAVNAAIHQSTAATTIIAVMVTAAFEAVSTVRSSGSTPICAASGAPFARGQGASVRR